MPLHLFITDSMPWKQNNKLNSFLKKISWMISFTCLDLLMCAKVAASRELFLFILLTHICHKRQMSLQTEKKFLSCQMPYKSCSCVCYYCENEVPTLYLYLKRVNELVVCFFYSIISFYFDQNLSNNLHRHLFCLLNVKYMIFNLIGMKLYINR